MSSGSKGRRPRGSKVSVVSKANVKEKLGELDICPQMSNASTATAAPKPKVRQSLRPNVILLLRHIKPKIATAQVRPSLMPLEPMPIETDVNEATLIQPLCEVAVESSSIEKKLQDFNKRIRCGEIKNSRCCYWDTQPFYTPPVHIPIRITKDYIDAKGWFCSPECALAHILKFSSSLDNPYEQQALLHLVYGTLYDTQEPFQPACDPRGVLDSFGGPLSIEEYRSLMRSGKQVQSLSRPLVKFVSEIHLVSNRNEHSKPMRGRRTLVSKSIHT